MSDTPRTDAEAFWPHDSQYKVCDAGFARQLERELNSANAIIRQQQLLDEENLRLQERIKRLESVTNDPHALWANWLRGSVTLPVGIGDVREYQDRIKRLEDIISRAAYAFFRDGSDGKAANGMLTILEEVRKP